MEIQKRGAIVSLTWEQIQDANRGINGHVEVTPKSPHFLEARAEFKKAWDSLTEVGLRLGYLEQEPCYECGGELMVTTNTEDRKWVSDDQQ